LNSEAVVGVWWIERPLCTASADLFSFYAGGFSFYAGGLWCGPCLGANPTDKAIIFILERVHRSYSPPDDKNNIAILRHVIPFKKILFSPA
jgi:hypothetical protein